MKLTTEHHFDLTFRFLQIQAINLIRVLTENDIVDDEKIRNIVEGYLFSIAYDLDQTYIRDPELPHRPYYPMVCFRDHEYAAEATEAVIPDGNDYFHEGAAGGAVDEVFERDVDDLGFDWDNGPWEAEE